MNELRDWKQLVEKSDEQAIIPFLKQLNEAQRKALLPEISKTAKAYLEIKDRVINNKHVFAKKASEIQERIINYSILVCCFNQKSSILKWLNPKFSLTKDVIANILSWHLPTWYADYINEFTQQEYLPTALKYETVLAMAQRRYIQPSAQLWAKLIPQIVFPEVPDEPLVYEFQPQQLFAKAITYKEHFWYLFQQETQIYTIERNLNIANKKKLPKNCWYAVIENGIKTGKIEQQKLIKATLEAMVNPAFNKSATGWFSSLFNFINPNETTLLLLQEQLFATYKSPHSKVVNTGLKAIKKITHHQNFSGKDSLKDYSLLLKSSTKSIVQNGLTILEILGENHPETRQDISLLAVHSFAHREEQLQLKAAKILINYSGSKKKHLSKTLSPYRAYMFNKIQLLLSDYLPKPINNLQKNGKPKYKKVNKISRTNKVVPIASFEDFLKLTLQIFNNNAPYHFDQFLTALLVYQDNLKGAAIARLTPTFKKAYQLVYNELPSNHGMLDNILAIFFLDLADYLISKYPNDSLPLKQLAETYLAQGFFISDESTPFDLHYAHLYLSLIHISEPTRPY